MAGQSSPARTTPAHLGPAGCVDRSKGGEGLRRGRQKGGVVCVVAAGTSIASTHRSGPDASCTRDGRGVCAAAVRTLPGMRQGAKQTDSCCVRDAGRKVFGREGRRQR